MITSTSMGKTFKDRKGRGALHLPRVPLITKRSEPFEDRRRKLPKHPVWQDHDDEFYVDDEDGYEFGEGY